MINDMWNKVLQVILCFFLFFLPALLPNKQTTNKQPDSVRWRLGISSHWAVMASQAARRNGGGQVYMVSEQTRGW